MAVTTMTTQFLGGPDIARQKIAAGITDICLVYECDVAIRLLANTIILSNQACASYTNQQDINKMANDNQKVLDDPGVCGPEAYDVGHVLFLLNQGGPDGFAPGRACRSDKATAATGSTNPDGFDFYISYVAHELGHQFGATHTFNSPKHSSARNASTALEPGSGSTIMSYAGICGTDNVVAASDRYFHSISVKQITDYVQNTATCSSNSPNSNVPPVVSAGPDYTIPARTPFMLTANGADLDSISSLTYCWEQHDRPTKATYLNDADDGAMPLFRSVPSTTSTQRCFPKLEDLLSGIKSNTEKLPTLARDMNMRVLLRDGEGGVSWDDTVLKVKDTGSAFEVSAPPAGTYKGAIDVTWQVAGTDQPQFNTPDVRVELFTHGGRVRHGTLASSTANDGSTMVLLPEADLANCRIKVRAPNNIFFNYSTADFSIKKPEEPPTLPPGGPDGPGPESGHPREIIRPMDPNEKIGPQGNGAPSYAVPPHSAMPYTIYFENMTTASAAVQEVTVTDYLSVHHDWGRFALGAFAAGDQVWNAPVETMNHHFEATVPVWTKSGAAWVTSGTALLLMDGSFFAQTGLARWHFRLVDPVTRDWLDDPYAGFLPPNDGSHRGEGYVSFTVAPRGAPPTGTVIGNQASIVFDNNVPIATNTWLNTVHHGETGSVRIDVLPSDRAWSLRDGKGQPHQGAGSKVLLGIPAGNVVLTWLPRPGYDTPAAEVQWLSSAGWVHFLNIGMPLSGTQARGHASLLRYLLGLSTSATGLDINQDRKVNSADLIYLQNRFAPDPPSSPFPADGVTSVTRMTHLDWSDSPRAIQYGLYLWTEQTAEPLTPTVRNLPSSGYAPSSALAASTRFRWRVEAVGETTKTLGPIWSFTTAP